jgi:sarcosine oxidase subunit beta
MARIVVAGSGSVGACIAYHLALLGAPDVVLADRGRIASGSTGKAMGGVRQQFSTAAEVRLAQESIAFFEELGVEWFQQVGYLFVATTAEGRDELEARRELQAELGVPVTRVDPSSVPGLRTDDILAAVFCPTDGVADPPALTWASSCASTPMPAGSSATSSSSRRGRTPVSSVSTCRSARSYDSCSRPSRLRTCRTTCRW